jgi:pimeloyl-ACP methyl ester carboxylesterase
MITKNVITDGRIRYVSQGSGSPVILLHGMAASFHDWKFLSPVLSDSGYLALAPDLLGHGESHKPEIPQAYTFDNLYDSLEKWIGELELEPSMMLVGHSLGGLLSLKYACDHPERVKGIVLIDPFYDPIQLSPILRMVNRRPSWGEKALQITPSWFISALMELDTKNPDQLDLDIRRQIAQDYKRASPYIFRFASSLPDLNENLQRVHVPTLVAWGMKDLTLDPATFPRLVQSMPTAQGQAIPECGHQPHLAKPDLVNKMILDFIKANL